MSRLLPAALALAAASLMISCAKQEPAEIRALLVTGGCCHDYAFQADTLTAALSARAPIQWTIRNEGGDSKDFKSPHYDDPNWAKAFDVIVHNECYANTDDAAYIAKIVDSHRAGTPAVVIHCAMHTYRAAKTDEWREFLGVTTRKHDHQSLYPVTVERADHPIMRGFPQNWVSPMDELYIIEKLWPNATSLASAKSEQTGESHPVFWINEYGKARVFGTTFGHTNDTMVNPEFQDIVARGILWATGRLD